MCQYERTCFEALSKDLLCQNGVCVRNELSCSKYREKRQIARSSSVVNSQMTISFFRGVIKPITEFA